MNRLFARSACLLLLAATVLASGCSREPAMGTVIGEVTLDGQPLKEGRVLFTPIDGQGQTGGANITDGKFTAQVPIAKMKVEINANKVIGKKRVYETPDSPLMDEVIEIIPHKYNINSELALEVREGEQSVRYDLKSR